MLHIIICWAWKVCCSIHSLFRFSASNQLININEMNMEIFSFLSIIYGINWCFIYPSMLIKFKQVKYFNTNIIVHSSWFHNMYNIDLTTTIASHLCHFLRSKRMIGYKKPKFSTHSLRTILVYSMFNIWELKLEWSGTKTDMLIYFHFPYSKHIVWTPITFIHNHDK